MEILEGLDITYTMRTNAEEKYSAIASYLFDNGIDADIYPQGSFALNTVVRPSKQAETLSYDLDVICQVNTEDRDYTPQELWKLIKVTLEQSELYKEKLTVHDECFTLTYSESGGAVFSIDLIPATHYVANTTTVLKFAEASFNPNVNTAINIAKRSDNGFTWINNDPKGYKLWFDNINAPFLAMTKAKEGQVVLESLNESFMCFEAVEEIPDDAYHSSLQRVIQLLKAHRNNYYAKLELEDIKPISAVITTLVAIIAEDYENKDCLFLDLLNFVVSEIEDYSILCQDNINSQEQHFSSEKKLAFTRKNGKWTLINPANAKDNLMDKWNDNPDIPQKFFEWLKNVRTTLIDSLYVNDEKRFFVALENAFGSHTVPHTLKVEPAKPIALTNAPKPYGCI